MEFLAEWCAGMGQLLESPLPLPGWLPDETLFSWASRYHALTGHRLSSETTLALFGHRRQGSQHDFPTRLGALVERTEGQLGDAHALIQRHTILPFYLRLRDPQDAAAAVAALVNPERGMLKFRLGMLTSRFRAHHPLKACAACMARDSSNFGVAYWHLAHQYPGSWICLQHRQPLLECRVKANGVRRFDWVMPCPEILSPQAESDEASRLALLRLAQLVAGWSSTANAHFDSDALAAAYRSACEARYPIDPFGRKARAQMRLDLCAAMAPLRCIPELQAFPATPREAGQQIDRWILAPRGSTHPLRHLAIIDWLFSSWSDFLQAYRETQESKAVASIEEQDLPGQQTSDARVLRFLDLLTSGHSVTAASRSIGIAVNTGLTWASHHGIRPARRSKTLNPQKIAALRRDLKRGSAKADAAARHGVSVQTVTRLLLTEPSLHTQWRAIAHAVRQRGAREAWTKVLDAFPGATLKQLRTRAGAAFAWLYRHDAGWLAQHPPQQLSATPTRPRVDWDSRDAAFSIAVRQVAAEIGTQSGQRLALWQIYQAVPDLRAKQGALERMPLTRQALHEVTRPRRRRKN